MKTVQGFLKLLIIPAVFAGCSHTFQTTSLQFADYRITPQLAKDSAIINFLRPYADTLGKTMDIPVAFNRARLEKKQPEGTLGNLLADACLTMSRERFNIPVDVAFINYGGIRVPEVPPGPITVGKVFEIMPFDNLLLVQEVSGRVLQQFLDFTAARGGWPTAGLTMKISDKKAVDVLIGGKPLDPGKIYKMANSDYIIHGGDRVDFLKDIPALDGGYLVRDALLDYLARFKEKGKEIDLKTEGRVVYAK